MSQTGCDIVYIPRFKKMLEETPSLYEKIFTAYELKDKSTDHLAGIYAAKEAAQKALSLPSGSWHEIEVQKLSNGAPKLLLSSSIKLSSDQVDLSISHDEDYAIAIVVMR